MSMATELWQQGDYHAALRGLQSETGESSLATLQHRHNGLLASAYTEEGAQEWRNLAVRLSEIQAISDREASTQQMQIGDDAAPVPDLQPLHGSALITLNQAVLLSHKEEYAAAIELLQQLAANTDALAPGIAQRVHLLLLDAHLATHQLEQATGTLQALRHDLHESLEQASAVEHDRYSGPATSQGLNPGDPSLACQLHVYQARIHLLQHNQEAAWQELDAALQLDSSASHVLSMKAQLCCERGELHEAAESAAASSFSRASGSSESAHGARQQQAAQIRLLNNAGCIQTAARKLHTAAVCFSNAQQQYARTISQPDEEIERASSSEAAQELSREADSAPAFSRGIPGLSGGLGITNHSAGLLYNGGVQALMLRRFDIALKSFEAATKAGHPGPLVWLRMAECCISLSTKHASPSSPLSQAPPRLASATAADDSAPGSADSAAQRAELAAQRVESAGGDSALQQLPGHAKAQWEARLAYAKQCLRTAALLAGQGEWDGAHGDGQGDEESRIYEAAASSSDASRPSSPVAHLASPTHPSTPKEAAQPDPAVALAIRRALVHVALLQEDYEGVLHGCEEILQAVPGDSSDAARAHCYAAEALYCTGHLQEACARLSQILPAPDPGSPQAVAAGKKSPPLKEVATANMAVVAAAMGDVSQVQASVSQLQQQGRSSPQAPTEVAILLALMQQGQSAAALSWLCQQQLASQ